MRPDSSFSRQRLIILILVLAAVFSPAAFEWMLNPEGAWYRPFFVWLLVIIVAFWFQQRRGDDHDF